VVVLLVDVLEVDVDVVVSCVVVVVVSTTHFCQVPLKLRSH
jgi:hypothetical protein